MYFSVATVYNSLLLKILSYIKKVFIINLKNGIIIFENLKEKFF